MPERGTCPCTAMSFIRNSASTLEHCLQSGLFCKEHLLLDGGSTDGTLELAAKYGCKVIPQDKRFLNEQGRIIDFASITNQGIYAAEYPWVASIDGDEILGEDLQKAIERRVAEGVPRAFFINRLYTLNGKVIEHASAYPNRQVKVWHRDAIEGFIKVVHERPKLKPGVEAGLLEGVQYVPLDPVDTLRRKSLGYIALELTVEGNYSWSQWLRISFQKILRIALRLFRILKIRILHPFGANLPLNYEWLNIWYAWTLIVWTSPFYRQRRRAGMKPS